MTAHPVAELLLQAASLNQSEHCPRRQGNVLSFDAGDRIVCAGDIHGDRGILARLLKHANPGGEGRRLILQELLHGGPADAQGADRSIEVLMRAARAKVQHPDGVFFILSNHDLAELTDGEISKDGCGACKSFRQGMANAFGEAAGEILAAVKTFIASCPLGARCANHVFISHSLPSPGREKCFDPAVLQRPYQDEDYRRGGSIYELVWGRRHDADCLEIMGQMLHAGLFLNGHQPQDNGYEHNGRQIIIASDHPLGCFAEFDAGEVIDPALFDTIVRRLNAIK